MPPLPSQHSAFASSSRLPSSRSRSPSSDDPDLPIHQHRPPAGHGPKPLPKVAPSFVKAVGEYDEYGKLVQREKGKEKEREGGTGAAEFWKGVRLEGEGGVGGQGEASGSSRQDTTSHSQRTAPRPNQPLPSTNSRPPISVPKSQWFIRRALLSSTPSSTSSTPSSPGSTTPTTSLANLLTSLPPPGEKDAWRPPEHYKLGRENVGFRMLVRQDWEGGGLGRREGEGTGNGNGAGEGSGNGSGAGGEVVKGKRRAEQGQGEERKPDVAGDGVEEDRKPIANSKDAPVDLTADDDDDEASSSSDDSDIEILDSNPSLPPPKFGDSYLSTLPSSTATTSGPGRVAPIATYLKSNLHGLGYTPTTSSGTLLKRRAVGEPLRKRVTHTEAEIRALGRGKVLGKEGGERKRAVREAKRERGERERWREIIGR